MAWSQAHYNQAIAMGLPPNTAAHIASRKRPGRALQRNYSNHTQAFGPPAAAGATNAQVAPPPPSEALDRTPIAAPDAVLLRPDTQVGIKRKKSRRDRLGLTNRGVSQFAYSPSAGLGGMGIGSSGLSV
jgi:hypothetical protein